MVPPGQAANATIRTSMSAHEPPLPKLLPGEEIVNVQHFPRTTSHAVISGIEGLERLANATTRLNIGLYGPVFASRGSDNERDRNFHRYEAIFGRDSLRVALDLIDKFPKLARSTLLALAQLQGFIQNNASEEEPGRIVHEVRDPVTDPIAQDLMRQYGWQWPYYGSVDSTPEFVRLIAAYCQRTHEGAAILRAEYVGRDGRVHDLAYALAQAMHWIIARLDANPEGLLEFKRRNPRGIENQVWKDSWDSYFHADGKIASHRRGIASVEVQRVAYDALLDAAAIYEQHLNKAPEAAELRERAERLRRMILDFFWTDDKGGYFVLGTDRDMHGKLRKLEVRTSNMGHLLHSRLLAGDDPGVVAKREAVIAQLFSKEMLCLNGIRTLAGDEVRFRPGAYHNGSCWGWDNYVIAQGLAAHGYVALTDYLEQVIIDDVEYAREYVEFMRGDSDQDYRINTMIVDVWDSKNQHMNRLEQPPQVMQAWTVAAVLAIKLARRKRQLSRLASDSSKRRIEQRILRELPEYTKPGQAPLTSQPAVAAA